MKLNEYSSQRKSVGSELEYDLSNKVICGNLIAIGYKLPIQSDFPALIPLHMWPPKELNRAESAISANGIDFVRVRIIRKPKIKTTKNYDNNEKQKIAAPKIKIEDKKVGRPSKQDKIIEAYIHLRDKGDVNYSKTFKSHTKPIRTTVRGGF